MKRHRSLFNRLILFYGASFILLSLASNTFLYFKLKHGLESESRMNLRARIETIQDLLKNSLQELKHRVEHEWPARSRKRVYVRILDHHLNPIAQTPHIPLSIISWLDADQKTLQNFEKTQKQFDDSDGEPYVAVSFLTEAPNGLDGPVIVQTITELLQAREFLDRYREIALGVAVLTILFSIVIGWKIAKESVLPIQEITDTVSRISSQNLHERLKANDLPIEFHTLACAFNETLDRLQESFDRLSQFSADIAHELRTPIAILRGEIEVTLGRGRNPEEYRETLGSALEECSRLTTLIESLLFLARSDSKNEKIRRENIELKPELESVIEFFEAAAQEANLDLVLDYQAEEGTKILAERTLFQRVLLNILSNAIRYSSGVQERKVLIRCIKIAQAGVSLSPRVKIEIGDEGPGISSEHLVRIFDRFYRVDSSRNPGSGGFGLGLAIAKSIAHLHGAEIYAESTLGKGTQIHLLWPGD